MEILINLIIAHPIVTLIVLLIIITIIIYNNLNSSKNRVEKSWSAIDTYLQQRNTMIKTLLDNANNAAGIDEDMQTKIAELRSGADNFGSFSINEKIKFNNNFKTFARTYENYPQFATIDLFKIASTEMVTEERQIGAARRQYNSNAARYNTKLTAFPTGMFAKMFGFNEKFELFTLDEQTRERMSNGDDLNTGALDAARKRNEQR